MQDASSSTRKDCDSADPPHGNSRWYAETIPRPGTNAQKHFAEGLFPWTVIPSALVCAAGLEILCYSTPLVENNDNCVTWDLAGLSLPVLGFVSVAINLEGTTYNMQKVHVVEGIDGGVWSPCQMRPYGFDAHINWNRGNMTRDESWLTTPTGRTINLKPGRFTFLSSFNRSSFFDDLRK